MNPNVSVNWLEVAFPVIMTVLVVVQVWRQGPSREDHLDRVGLSAIMLALASLSVANLFYQGVFNVRAWPTVGIFDQVVVTPVGDIFVKVKDPMLGRADRVQRYNCRGEFTAAFQPDGAGGVFKIAVNPDNTLSIYSVRTDTIDTFNSDGTFLQRSEVDSQQMPFEFLKSGPSVTSANGCEFPMDSISGRPAAKNSAGIWPLERGDWLLARVLNRRNMIGAALFGGLMLVLSYIKMRKQRAAAGAGREQIGL
ncbi:hypothetical protein [Candidatus Phyllobacterium onerii]|uniref:hypothetical protein n=1 Tax=Candidatus Phyllobacterium onerii TaxID=3020828 RepID=UPI00232E9EF1|nr:hypothetical protein [Phyllobacterium sp. IY22]